MRGKIALCILLTFSLPTLAKVKTADDFYKESQSLRGLSSKEKDSKQKSRHLKKLEEAMKLALDEYEKIHPQKGDKTEEEISVLFYTLEPVFKLSKASKINSEKCAQVRQEVKTGDQMSAEEERKTASKQAQEAFKWLDEICP